MSELRDLLLPMPLPEAWFRPLLFFTFFLHFVFVLLTIGTAILAISSLVSGQLAASRRTAQEPGGRLSRFFVYKSLAIVLGIGPLLLVQVGYAVPFITAANLVGPLWMGVVVFLIAALIFLEIVRQRRGSHGLPDIVLGLLGLACLLAVPAVLSLVVVTTENPRAWMGLIDDGRLPWSLSWHWLFRLLHVVGAAVVITAGFEFLRAGSTLRRERLRGWIVGGLAFQFALGVALYASLPRPPQAMIVGWLVAGVAAAGVLLWQVSRPFRLWTGMAKVALLGLLGVVLTPMLVSRQLLQDQVLVPLQQSLVANAEEYREAIKKARAQLGRDNRPDPPVRQTSESLYLRSCVFCHGTVANGQGEDAASLEIPPEDLSAVRAGRGELRRILREGVPATGMPPFRFYTAAQIEGILNFLERYAGLHSAPEPISHQLTDGDRNEAARMYLGTCSACHGNDGGGSELGGTLSPAPPDLRVYTLSPERTLAIITRGYPGTLMPAFSKLPEGTRWGLVEVVHGLYQKDAAAR